MRSSLGDLEQDLYLIFHHKVFIELGTGNVNDKGRGGRVYHLFLKADRVRVDS